MARLRTLAAAAWLAAVLGSAPARAEVSVTGDAGDLVVEADEAPLEDVIVAVAEAVGSTIEPPEDTPATLVTGVYRGSVSEVLKALMPSSDFFVAWRDGAVEVHFLAEGERPSVAEASPAEPGNEDEAPPPERPGKQGGWPGGHDARPGKQGEGKGPPAPARRIY